MKVLAAILMIVCISHVDMFHNFYEHGDDIRKFESIPWKPLDEHGVAPLQNGDFYFVDGNLKLHVVNENDKVDEKYIEDYISNRNNTRYYLYTRSNPTEPQRLYPKNFDSVLNSNFDSEKVTIFLVHGWMENYRAKINTILIKAFLRNSDVNVIVVDWSYKAKTINYITAKNATPIVGIIVGQFIKWLIDNDFATYERLHLVGFSLGGHVVGSIGRKNHGYIARITALDPAGPLWTSDPTRLNREDAQYVEVIHTNTMLSNWPISRFFTGLGIEEPCGHADFYVNGGHFQPSCNVVTNNLGCAHYFSVYVMGSSIRYNKFMAHQCENLDAVKKDYCYGPPGHMGHTELSKPISGIFRLNTRKDYPYYITD